MNFPKFGSTRKNWLKENYLSNFLYLTWHVIEWLFTKMFLEKNSKTLSHVKLNKKNSYISCKAK